MAKNQKQSFDSMSADIQLVLNDMEKRRKSYIFPAIWQGLLAGLVIAIIVFFFMGEIFFTLIISLICGVWGAFYYKRILLSAIYKKEIMPRLVATLGDDVNYDPKGGLDKDSFIGCKLFRVRDRDYANSEDCIFGLSGKTEFYFCEANYGYEKSGSDREDVKHEEFSGLAFEANFNKDFRGVTLLCASRPDDLSRSEYPEVTLEDPAFKKVFRVYATDETEARYILSPALQERFVRLEEGIRKSIGEKKMMVSFFNSRILILIPSSKNRFEAQILSPLKLKRVQKDFELIYALTGIVDELNLNTRIWSKQ